MKRCAIILCSLKPSFDFYIIDNSNVNSNTLDGGTRILIEILKRWSDCGYTANLLVTKEGYEVLQRYGLSKVRYTLISSLKMGILNLYLIYLLRMFNACFWALVVKISRVKDVIIYSGSDFWPDSVPAWILKMRFRKAKWVAGFYLFAPSPFSKESPYKGSKRLRGLLYYVSQLPIYWLVRRYADMVWVTSEPDRWKFIGSRLSLNKIVAVQGGVDVKTPASIPEPIEKRFDAVFIGRFHLQKGVLELMDIWRYVVEKKKDAKLAMIGVGGLERELREKIRKNGLGNNITFFGFKDGVEKLKIFKDSKIVVHPAIYDSGGMAAGEAMACGLPGVSFDLPALRTYYPKGMLKTPCFYLEAFSENILRLLNDEKLYEMTAKDALDWSKEWDWDKRAKYLLEVIREA